MDNFLKSCALETLRFFCKRNIVLLLILMVLLIVSVKTGVRDYSLELDGNIEFQRNQMDLFNSLNTYGAYSERGIGLSIKPSILTSLFANPVLVNDLGARINSISVLEIQTNPKARLIIGGNSYFEMKFSNIILLLGGLVLLFLGLDSLRNKEYLRFITDNNSLIKTYISVVLTRILLMIVCFFVFLGVAVYIVLSEGIQFSELDITGIWGYVFAVLQMFLFYFSVGTVIGVIFPNGKGYFSIMVFWMLFLWVIPGVMNNVLSEQNKKLNTQLQLHSKKYQIITEFERKAIKKHGRFKDNAPEGRKKVIESFWNNEFKRMEEQEEKFLSDISNVVKSHVSLSMLTPTTFYNLVTSEANSCGYLNYLNFYSYSKEMRKLFTRFWIDRVYYNDPKKMVSFIKGDENIFIAQSRIPENFLFGLLLNLFYSAVLLVVSFLIFKRKMFPAPSDASIYKGFQLEIKPDRVYNFIHYTPELVDQFYNTYYGAKASESLGWEIKPDREIKGLMYVPNIDQIPGEIKVGALVKYFNDGSLSDSEFDRIMGDYKCLFSRRFDQLKQAEQGGVLLSLVELRQASVDAVIFNDFFCGVPRHLQGNVSARGLALAEKGVLLINLRRDDSSWVNVFSVRTLLFMDGKIHKIPDYETV